MITLALHITYNNPYTFPLQQYNNTTIQQYSYVPSKGLQLAQKSIQDLQKGGSGKFVVQEGNLRQGRPFEFSFNEGQRGLKFLNDKQNYPVRILDCSSLFPPSLPSCDVDIYPIFPSIHTHIFIFTYTTTRATTYTSITP